MSKLSFKRVLLYRNQNTHFAIFIQGDMFFTMLETKLENKLYPNLKGIM